MNDPTKRQRPVTWPRRLDWTLGAIGIMILLGFCFAAPQYPDHVRLLFWGMTVPSEFLLAILAVITWAREPNKE